MAKAREIEGLDCHAPAPAGMRLVLLTRLDEMCSLRTAALDWTHMDGVHDMRVASRRLRTTLKDFQPFLAEKIQQRKLREVARALGAVRDEDVAIAALEKLTPEVPEEARDGLNRIIAERRWFRDGAREVLEEEIREASIERLRQKLKFAIERATRSPSPVAPQGYNNNSRFNVDSFRTVGRKIILNGLGELLELGESLYRPFKIEPLHTMRIAAKRLRYAMELFTTCWGDSLHALSVEVAGMQEFLGDLHDSDVWIEGFGMRLKGRGEIREGVGEAAAGTREATTWLLQHFTKERTKHYRHALAQWLEWEKTGFRSRLIETLSREPERTPDETQSTVSIVS